jgi:hypothetical protein
MFAFEALADLKRPSDSPFDIDEPFIPPEGKSTAEWCLEPDEEYVSVLGALISEGDRLIVGGATGAGKTSFVMRMVAAVATGDEFLGMAGCGGMVLYIDLEQGKRAMRRRMREAGLDETDNVNYVRSPDGLNLMGHEPSLWLERTIEAGWRGQSYKLVVIDPLYKAHTGDSSDERAMVDLMRRIDTLRDKHQFALVIPMHFRKNAGTEGAPTIHDIFGSGGLVWGAETVVGLQRVNDGVSNLYFWKDREGPFTDYTEGVDHWQLFFSQESGFRRSEKEAKIMSRVDARSQITAYVMQNPGPYLITEFEEKFGLEYDTARKAVGVMVKEGTLVNTGMKVGKQIVYDLPGNSIISAAGGGGRVTVDSIGGNIEGGKDAAE